MLKTFHPRGDHRPLALVQVAALNRRPVSRRFPWPTLETAIEQKLEDQAEFVRWWAENVRPRGRPDEIVSAQKRLSVEKAEEATGITKLQTFKWRRRLTDPEKYRAMLFGAAYHKAMAEARARR